MRAFSAGPDESVGMGPAKKSGVCSGLVESVGSAIMGILRGRTLRGRGFDGGALEELSRPRLGSGKGFEAAAAAADSALGDRELCLLPLAVLSDFAELC